MMDDLEDEIGDLTLLANRQLAASGRCDGARDVFTFHTHWEYCKIEIIILGVKCFAFASINLQAINSQCSQLPRFRNIWLPMQTSATLLFQSNRVQAVFLTFQGSRHLTRGFKKERFVRRFLLTLQ